MWPSVDTMVKQPSMLTVTLKKVIQSIKRQFVVWGTPKCGIISLVALEWAGKDQISISTIPKLILAM